MIGKSLRMAFLPILLTTLFASTGCDTNLVTENARLSAAGFLTSLFTDAVNASIGAN